MLEKTKEAIIDELATAVKRGELVVFLGSGLSTAAGVPSWTTLVKDLKEASDVQDVSTRLQPLLQKVPGTFQTYIAYWPNCPFEVWSRRTSTDF